jgi:lysophospholipase L1-like esterase
MPCVSSRPNRITALLAAAAVGVLLIGAFFAVREIRAASTTRTACNTVTAQIAERGPGPVSRGGAVAVVLGDSYSQGVGLDDQKGQAWASRLGATEGWTTYVDGIGQTGFTNGGFCGGQEYRARTAAALAHQPQVVVVQGGLNDTEADPSQLRSAADQVLGTLSAAPRLIVVGPPPAPGKPGAEKVDRVLADATRAAGRQYVSPIGWQLPYLPDQVHLTPAGHEQFARMVADVID